MFYSQFILAKKGPLGTIWIAAHLERKLRKNQVADTDIGLSVDSILFPEVPIALRLSSHLLLGVVRIYSKKVNYLFHDCSEALVKIKQAFRSTTVDLPPEESTAPYHSITLPETFDLDNFELPESALLSSNFVDHHVSTREQITLQDAVNGTSHPTSMFGLDEKFGDGDASHIGLELEQELFMDKHFSPLPASFSIGFKEGVFQGEPSLPSTSLGNDGQFSYNEGNFSEIPNELSELLCNNHDREGFSRLEALRRNEDKIHRHIYSIQTPDLNEVFIPDCQLAPSPLIVLTPEEVQTPCLIEPAQGPSTPGLLEEIIPSNFQEIPALSPHERAAMPAEPGRPWRNSGLFMEVEYPEAGNEAGHTDTLAVDHSLGGTAEGLSSSVVFEQRSGSLALTHLAENLTTHNSCLPSGTEHTIGKSTDNEVTDLSVAEQMQDNSEVILPSAVFDETGNLDLHIKLETFSAAEPISSNFSTDNVNKVDVSGAIGDAKTTAHNSTEPSNMTNLNHAEDIGSCLSRNTSAIESGFPLRPCSSNLHQDVTLVEISEQSHREQFCSLEIPIREEAPHIRESSREVQGDDLRSTNFGDFNLEQQQKPGYISSGVKSDFIEPLELSMCGLSNVNKPDRFNYSSSSEFLEPEKMLAPACFADFPNDTRQQTAYKGFAVSDGSADRISTLSKVVQQDHLNYFSSSEFLEPEMLAPACNVDFSNDKGQQTADKGVAESDGSVDRFSTLYNKKRQAMYDTTVQQTGTAAKSSGVPRSWRNSVPDDDDLLASILVGRKSQFLKIGTRLSPSTASSHKRPRTMPKVGLLKGRKVLVDDTVFLHADTIRQQLLNTEDIRRIRKKVPCTRPDIWKIHIYEEDGIFKNCVLTGVAAELNSLECKRYNLHVNQSAQVKIHNSLSNPSGESQFVNEASGKVLGESVVIPPSLDHVGDRGPLVMSGADMEQTHEDANQPVVKEQIEQMSVRPQMEPLNEGPDSLMSEIKSVAWRDSDLKMTVTCITENAETCPPLEKHDNESINDSMLSEVEADARGGFHLSMTETRIAENGETCLPLEKPDTASINIMQQSLLSEDRDCRNTPFDGLERATMETDNPVVVFMDSEQVNPEDESNAVGTSSKEADARGGFHLSMTETYIAENGGLPLEKPDASSINIMEQTLLSEDRDSRNTPLDGLECATMETTDNPTIVFMESEQIHADDESNAVGTSSKEKEKHANDVDLENSECSQTRLFHSIEIDGASVSVRGSAPDSGAELLLEGSIGLAAAVEGHSLMVSANEGSSIPGTCAEVELMASISAPTEHIPFTVEEHTFVQEQDLEAGLHIHDNSMDVAEARDSSDFCSTIDDNYAELLNADDEAPNPEAAKLFENSGWSVRTRGVAKYLKNLFHEESVRGRRTVAVDRLLFGKTRKEASRMFFETLVLKSRDYIQVEQETPFAYINIKPRIKLVESEF